MGVAALALGSGSAMPIGQGRGAWTPPGAVSLASPEPPDGSGVPPAGTTASTSPASSSPSPPSSSTSPFASGPSASSGQSPGSASPAWVDVLAELDRHRTTALMALDANQLAGYAVRASPAWAQDAELIARLSAQGVRPSGLTTRVVSAQERPGRASPELEVLDQRSGYDLVDEHGDVVATVEASVPRRWLVRLAQLNVGDGSATPGTGRAQDGSQGAPGGSAAPDPGWRVVEVIEL